jgi:imidazolonepropionase-like amidohydrolase
MFNTWLISAFLPFLLALLLLVPLGSARASTAAPAFVVRGAAVFDGQALQPPADVLVQEGRIARIGAALAVPAGTAEVSGRGRTLLPGLIDAHTHSWGTARRDAIRMGVTTEIEMFGDHRGLAAAKAQRESLAPAALADLWSAGTLATVPRGHGTQYGIAVPTLMQPAEADAFVAARFAEGSDFLKIVIENGSAFGQTTPSLQADSVAALVKAAKARGKLAVAHVSTQADAEVALAAGVDGLVHIAKDRAPAPEWLATARQRGVFVVATLSVVASVAASNEGKQLADDTRLQPWLAIGQRTSLRQTFPPNWQRPALLPQAMQNVRALHQAGLVILAGTDAGNAGTAHGASMHGELDLLVRAGLTPTQALSAATALPARAFGLADRGRIAVGQRADLLLVEGDPTRDITTTRAIAAVWKNGAPVDRSLQPDEREAAAAPAAPADAAVADFEAGSVAVVYGQNWMITADSMAGGKSSATQAWLAGGAEASRGALRVQGQVDGGLPYAWAGTMFMPGAQPFAAVDFSARKTLVLKVRSAGEAATKEISAMIFSGPPTQRQPAVVRFATTPQWAEVRIPLQRFQNADLQQLRALAFTAGPTPGPFSFDIDDIRIE